MDRDLGARLRSAGVDPAAPGDPAAAWLRLFAAFGERATLIDRYALEAASRGVAVEELSAADRGRMAREVLAARYPGFQLHGSPRGDPIEVVPYDPEWPARFRRWRERLAVALGAAAVRIDHIGSTAVPGLAAKPVVDVQVSVADVEDEAAFRPAIESAGVALRSREPGHRYFRPGPGSPREVQVHVWQAGGEFERAHLLFRDYLRSHPAVRDAYASLKRGLAEEYRHDRVGYNEAKTGFILDALGDAERWAAATGWAPDEPT